MNKKDSRLSNVNVPALVMYVQDAHKKIFGKKLFIRNEAALRRFSELQKRLQKEDISIIDYADNIMMLVKGWMKERNMTSVPLNLLTGDWLYNKYKKLKSQTSVKLVDDNDISEDVLYEDELLVANTFIQRCTTTNSSIQFYSIVEQLGDVLSDEWKCQFESGKLRLYEVKVLNELEVLHNVSAISYRDLANKLRNGNN